MMNLPGIVGKTMAIVETSGVESQSLGERFAFGLKYTVIGMAIVFSVLILLMLVLYVFKLVYMIRNKKSGGETVSPSASAPAAPAAERSPAGESEDEALVAAISAAIAAFRGESECAFDILSIEKVS